MEQVLKPIMQEITSVIDKVDETKMDEIVKVMDKTKRVFVVGEGRSGLTAKAFAMRLMHLGYTVFVVGETITPAINEGDIFIGVSGSGTSAHVIFDVEKAEKKGCQVIAVTSKEDSPLAKLASHVLVVPGTVKGDQGENRGSIQLLSSLFDQSLHIVLDALCLKISFYNETANDQATKAHW